MGAIFIVPSGLLPNAASALSLVSPRGMAIGFDSLRAAIRIGQQRIAPFNGEHALMFDAKPPKEIRQVMQFVVAWTRRYFVSEFGIDVTEADSGGGELKSLSLLDMTAIIGMGGSINLLIAFSFQEELVNALYRRMTEKLDIAPDQVKMYREAAASEVANTILGHSTIDLQKFDSEVISMTPPVILDGVKSIRRMKDSMFYAQTLNTALGGMNINLVGPRELFDTCLDNTR